MFLFNPIAFVFDAIVFCLLLAIAVYDFRHKIIPDGLVYTFIGVSLVKVLYFTGFSHILSYPFYLDLLTGPILFLFFYILWAVSRGRWIGFGDAKLALGVGWFMGFYASISAIILSFWLGAIISLILVALGKLNFLPKKLTIKSEVPFAPFIILSVLVEYFVHFDFFSLKSLF